MNVSKHLVFIGLLAVAIACTKQDEVSGPQDDGTLFVTLGKDTTILQQFKIRGDSIFSKFIFRPNGITIAEGKGSLYPDGQLKGMVSKAYKISKTGELQLIQETVTTTSADSTFTDIKRDAEFIHKKIDGHGIVSNEGDITTFYLFPYWGFFAPRNVNDSIVSNQFAFRGKRSYVVKRTSDSTLRVGSNLMGRLTLLLEGDGGLKSIQGTGSSLNIVAFVKRSFNFDSLQSLLIERQLKYGVTLTTAPRDTVTFVYGKTLITLDYGQPSVRGRKIFGEVVPWNRFWRAGANAATSITTSSPLLIEGQLLPAGSYTLFMMPKEEPGQWTLMINRKTGIWGTDYDSTEDALLIPMKTESLTEPIEMLAYQIIPNGKGGTISLTWANTRVAVAFKIK